MTLSRRAALQALGFAAVGTPLALSAQGRCMLTFGSPACNTADVTPPFGPTGWQTTALDHITVRLADYKSEAAFYIALMGWKLRSDDGTQAVLDMGDWGSAIFKQAAGPINAPAQGGVRNAPARAVVESFAFAIEPWNTDKVEAELQRRGLRPVAEHDGKGFESFRVKDPDGYDLQIGNGNGLVRSRKTTPAAAKLSEPAPFASTGWKTVWLDHFSFNASNYKTSASFYSNLLGWAPTYDEGSQNELLMGETGDIIVRGGNPLDPGFGKTPGRRAGGSIDHISFGIAPWDTDGVRAELEKRGLKATVDTSSRHLGPDGTWLPDEIHTAAFKSYHTETPNGFNLQISYVTHGNRLALPNAVKPKPAAGR